MSEERVDRFGRNTLTIVDENPGGSSVYGALGADDADALARFGRGRMYYARQFMSLNVYNFVLSKLSEKRRRRVLHVGCGVDYVRRVMEANYCICDEYVGIDLHLPNLREALRHTNAIAADYFAMDLSRGLERWPSNYFDAVIAMDVVEHMPTKEQGKLLFSEILRVANELAVVSTPQVLDAEVRYSDLHKYEFTRQELLEIMGSYEDKFTTQEMYGVNIGTKEFMAELEKESPWVRTATEMLTPKIMRGIYAAGNPEISNDVVISFER